MWVIIILLVVGGIVLSKARKSTLIPNEFGRTEVCSKANSNRSALGPQDIFERAHKMLENSPEKEKATIITAHKAMLEIIINNIRCLPKKIIEMEYTQKAIQAFIMHYAVIITAPRLTNTDHVYTISMLTIEQLQKKGVMNFANFDNNIYKDPRFKTMPMMLRLFSQAPIKDQTALLVFIEKHMESQLGRRVRYIGQRPTDNPLNAQE